MRKNITLGLILGSTLALVTLAVAAPAAPSGDTHHGRHSHGHDHDMGLRKLDLTDAQRANIKQVMYSSVAQNKTQRDALRQQRDAFESMTPDQLAIRRRRRGWHRLKATPPASGCSRRPRSARRSTRC